VRKYFVAAVAALATTAALAGTGISPASAATARGATAISCPAADTWTLQNYYGFAAYLDSVWRISTAIETPVCDEPGAGENNWDHLEEIFTGQCITWNGSSNAIYDASCGRYPAAQSWGFIPQSGGTQIENYYAGKCLAGDSSTSTLYLYECAPNGNTAQDWDISAG
jgi:hypothetical protein